MKTYLLLLALIGGQSYASFGQDWNKTPYQTKSLASDAIKDVAVNTAGGSIMVSGASGEAARIEVFVTGNNGRELSKDEIKKRLDEDYILQISVNNHQLKAEAKRKHDGDWDWKRQLSISFKIYVPKQVATHLNTSGGGIRLDNLTGQENFTTSGGSLNLNNLAGEIKGETSGGSIDIANSKDIINLETSGGNIHASNCQGKLKLETSGGSLHLESLSGSINASTSGGNVSGSNIAGELITGTSGGSVNLSRLSCSLDASTSGGNMNIEILHAGKYVKLDISGGNLSLKLPSKQGLDLNLNAERISASTANAFSGTWEKDHVKGSINGGGIPVHAEVNGRLDLSFN
ncbi:hypothetical protein [Mucilaginibacter sp.]|uniref:hypothetical protein n=1 Tax=Mucilaginibacter sp. TaxID=1882438 RepID=UPI003D10B73E